MKIRATVVELAMIALLIALLWVELTHLAADRDLTCRVARMETLAVSAEPLPDCIEEKRNG